VVQLVFQTAFIGDLLLGSALLKQIRKLAPEDKIALVCRKGCGELFLKLNLADEVFEVDKKDSRSWQSLKKALRGREFSRIFCPHESLRSAFFVRSLKSPVKIGFSHWWNGLIFNYRVRRPMQLPESLRQLALLKAIDRDFAKKFAIVEQDARNFNTSERGLVSAWAAPIPDFAKIETPPTAEVHALIKTKFANELAGIESAVFLAPGSVWATKMWTADGFREVAKHFSEAGRKVIFTGSPNEKAICDDLAASVPGAVNLAGRTSLTELHALYCLGSLVVSNDSSPIHLAAMAGTPCVGIFGATTLNLGFRPWSDSAMVAQIDLDCRPCGLHGHHICPLGHHNCMKNLPSSAVINLANRLLRQQ
jgi:heptosyltransferase II